MSDGFHSLNAEELLVVLKDFASNWLAHDGTWFLAAEKRHGMEEAITLDKEAWREFSPVEARRIMKRHNLPKNGGLDALAKALDLRMYALLNKQVIERQGDAVILRMVDCRVQSARRQKNLPDFPCKEVGIIEYTEFAKAIDPRFRCECIACPPDAGERDYYCAWKFTLEEE